MANVLTKFLYLGYSLEEVIDAVTNNAAEWLEETRAWADSSRRYCKLNFIYGEDEPITLIDSEGEQRIAERRIDTKGVVINGDSLNAKYGLKRVINASGRMSILGVSAPTDTVMDAMKQGGQNYVEIADLVDKAGEHIARILDSEAAVVVNSASSGIALSIAGYRYRRKSP